MASVEYSSGDGGPIAEYTKTNSQIAKKDVILINLTDESDHEQLPTKYKVNEPQVIVIDDVSDQEGKSNESTVWKPTMVTDEELAAILKKHSLTGDPREERMEESSKLVKAYLIKNAPEFERVMNFRDRVRRFPWLFTPQ